MTRERPCSDCPILSGEDARRFHEEMMNPTPLSPEARRMVQEACRIARDMEVNPIKLFREYFSFWYDTGVKRPVTREDVYKLCDEIAKDKQLVINNGRKLGWWKE